MNIVDEPIALANTIRQRLLDKQRAEEAEKRRKEEEEKAEKAKTNKNRKKLKIKKLEEPVYSQGTWCTYSPSKRADWHFRRGCTEDYKDEAGPLKVWLSSSADLLFVIGFCVIAFLKFIFLSILHYEIREMIQKIYMLENETNQMNGGLAAALGLRPEICSDTSSDNRNDSRSSTTPSCHSSQGSLHPPQTANTILSYPITTEPLSTRNGHNLDKNPVAIPNAIGSFAHKSVEELIDTKTTSTELVESNFIPMTTVSTKQLVNTDTYDCKPLPPPPTKTKKSSTKEDLSDANPRSNRILSLNTDITPLPQPQDLVTSSTATTAQSSSGSTINKPGEFVIRSSEVSVLSPQSEKWPLGSSKYFANNSDICSGVLDDSTKGEKHSSEHHELSNKNISTVKCDSTIPSQFQEFIDLDKDNIVKRSCHRHCVGDRNLIPTTSDGVYSGNTSVSYYSNPNVLFKETECIAQGTVRSTNGGSSKQTAI